MNSRAEQYGPHNYGHHDYDGSFDTISISISQYAYEFKMPFARQMYA